MPDGVGDTQGRFVMSVKLGVKEGVEEDHLREREGVALPLVVRPVIALKLEGERVGGVVPRL